MTTTQLSALLEVFPEPALVSDQTGTIVACNRAATDCAWEGSDRLPPDVELHELGEGLRLARRKPSPDTASPVAAGTEPSPYPAEIDTLARGIVHEIRNPLAAILTAAKLVQDDPQAAEETTMLLGVIRKESLRINDILSEFSDYVKPRTSKPAVVDLALAARETIAEMRRDDILGPSVTVEDSLQSPLKAWADESHFRNALVQILKNAVDANSFDPALRLSAQQENDRVMFYIDDNGPGFSEESLRRAFQPFYSTKSQSTGLGLSLAQASIQASGGRVWIKNLSTPADSSQVIGTPTQPEAATDRLQPGGTLPHMQGARACIELPLALLGT